MITEQLTYTYIKSAFLTYSVIHSHSLSHWTSFYEGNLMSLALGYTLGMWWKQKLTHSLILEVYKLLSVYSAKVIAAFYYHNAGFGWNTRE